MTKPQQNDFEKRLRDYLANTGKRNKPILVCETPNVLIAVGAKPLPILINPNDIDKCLAERAANKNKNSHNLTVEELCVLPELLAIPTLIFKAPDRQGYISVITDRFDKDGNPFVIGLEMGGNNEQQLHNRVTSMYARENALTPFIAKNGKKVQGFIRRMIEDGNLIAYHKQKVSTLFQLQEIISIREENVVTFDDNVLHSLESVNYNH